MEKFKVTFYPDNKSVEVEKDKTILSAAISAGIYLNSVCGGDAVCGRCKVRVKKGDYSSKASGLLSQEERGQGMCLACEAEVQGDLEVEVPAESRLNLEQSLYSKPEDVEPIKFREAAFAILPLTKKIYLELAPPNLDDKISDLERLEQALFKKTGIDVRYTGLANLKNLSELLRDADWKVTITLGTRREVGEIILIEAGDTSGKNFGFVFDIGTTTVSGQLVDLISGQVLGTKATYNKQAAFGADVITRIIYAREKDGLETLHQAVSDDINEMIKAITAESRIDLNQVSCISCTGNTTMIHLLLRIDPTYIRRQPYVPTLNFVPVLRASEAGLMINPRGILACLPGVASYVGADVTAGVLASAMDKSDELSILIDIGTNGEVVLGNKEFLIACAASAGPAFEGSGVSCGMRASRGAIQKVKISEKDLSTSYSVIGQGEPVGICGSGYIDLIAEMLRLGIMDKNGKIKDLKTESIRKAEFGREFVIHKDIVINEADIENLKRAKAAVFSAVSILVKHMGFKFSDVKKIFIAGGFGTYLDMENAKAIGLLPALAKERFVFVGNSALSGARLALLSQEARESADEIARKMSYFELSVEPGYMEEYMAALFFPHTDLTLFPGFRNS